MPKKNSFEKVRLSNRVIKPHKSVKEPNFKAKAVHVTNGLQYVEMLLKLQDKKAALFWSQGKGFYEATKKVEMLSKPLTAYYCVLNLSKALLTYNKVKFPERVKHGVSGKRNGTKASLSNEVVLFSGAGVFTELRRFYGEDVGKKEYTLFDIFYNLQYIHRAFCITFSSKERNELFIPLENARFIKIKGNSEAYFQADLAENWSTSHIIKKLPKGFEKYPTAPLPEERLSIRYKKRFKWKGKSEKLKLKELSSYQTKLRKDISYIYDCPDIWYLKRDIAGAIPHSSTVLTFAALHRLSEIARYEPQFLEKHFNNKYNWLLAEFLNRCLEQIIDEITAEITKKELRASGQ